MLDVLDKMDFDDPNPLKSGGFVFGLIIQHEHQHDETMLATLQLSREPGLVGDGDLPAGRPDVGRGVRPGGPFTMGTDLNPWAYDNERPAHTVDVPAFWIDRVPVTNGDYLAFVEDGGYRDPRWWHPEGFRLGLPGAAVLDPRRRRHLVAHPLRPSASRSRRTSRCSTWSWYEADAYARWAGKRLPTEPEVGEGLRLEPEEARSRRCPWGDEPPTPELANLGHRAARPASVGAYPAGTGPTACEQMIGDVWEWTSSTFQGYPGFRAFPYREYSEVFFRGPDYRVLRGGSWAADPAAVRATFRNWDYPQPPPDLRRLPLRPRRRRGGEGSLMCRHAAWLGEPRPLSSLIQRPDHGLLKQSYVPRRQRWGTVNADGFGMGW